MGGSLTVPSPFDVIIDGQGYIFHDAESDKALFGNTPTFVSRQNTQGNYGDNQQDSFLTVTQSDWSLGEQQKYFRGNDAERARKFWRGGNIDASVPGEASITRAVTSYTPAAATRAAAGRLDSDLVYYATSTNVYTINYAGTITDRGAHGLGVTPYFQGCAFDDGGNFYLTAVAGGSVGVRRLSTAFAYTTYSATTATSLAWLNNALYGYNAATGQLLRYTPGAEPVASTVLFTWQTGTGAAVTMDGLLKPFGGKLLLLRYPFGNPGELWLYDGTAPAKIAEFPPNFSVFDIEVIGDTVFVSGFYERHSGATSEGRPAVLFYKGGSQGELWRAEQHYGNSVRTVPLAVLDGQLVFIDPAGFPADSAPRLLAYNPESGAVTTVVDNTSTNNILVSAGTFLITANSFGTNEHKIYPDDADTSSSGFVDTSLIDFDSSLPKIIRGIRADFVATGTGTVDLAYRYNDINGSYTTLQTNVTSGQEYAIATPAEATTYRSVSVRATLNRGATTTSNVKLNRLAVRGLSVLPAYKKRTYVLYLGGVDGESPVRLRDGTSHAMDGKDMATNLQTAAGRTSPFSITDHLGTFTGRIDEGGLEMVEVKPQVWVARVRVREV